MTAEQDERMVAAQERLAAAWERIADQGDRPPAEETPADRRIRLKEEQARELMADQQIAEAIQQSDEAVYRRDDLKLRKARQVQEKRQLIVSGLLNPDGTERSEAEIMAGVAEERAAQILRDQTEAAARQRKLDERRQKLGL